jgi:heptosyltransferase-2
MRIALLLPNWIGDAVMTTPALRALRRQFRDAALVGIARPAICELLEGVASLDALRPIEAEGTGLARIRDLARVLRAGGFDLAIHFTNSLGAALAARLAGVPERVGYVRRGRGPLLTRRLHPARDGGRLKPVSAVDYYLGLAEALGCAPEPPILELATGAEDEAAADRLWQGFRARAAKPVIAINNSGAFGEAKLWPDEHLAALVRRLTQELDQNVVLLAGPADAARMAGIRDAVACPHLLATAAEPSLGLSKAVVRRSRLLVTTDSGPRHFAAAFGVPAVVLFGPTDPRWTDLHSERERWLQLGLDCQPCQQRRCPLGHHRCMRDLGVDRVAAAIAETLPLGAAASQP